MPLDYSRFAAIADEDERLHGPDSSARPEVTRFSQPRSVTIGPSSLPGQASSSMTGTSPAASRGGGHVGNTDPTEGGMDAGAFLWSQTAQEVVVRVPLPTSAKAKQVQVQLLPGPRLIVQHSGQVLVQGTLAYRVWGDDHREEAGEDDSRAMDWQLEDLDAKRRCVVIRLSKQSPGPGMVVWWQRVFKDSNEPVLDKVVGDAAKRAQTQQAWEEAHRMFRERRAQERAAREAGADGEVVDDQVTR